MVGLAEKVEGLGLQEGSIGAHIKYVAFRSRKLPAAKIQRVGGKGRASDCRFSAPRSYPKGPKDPIIRYSGLG